MLGTPPNLTYHPSGRIPHTGMVLTRVHGERRTYVSTSLTFVLILIIRCHTLPILPTRGPGEKI